MEFSCEHDDERSGSIKCGRSLDKLRNYCFSTRTMFRKVSYGIMYWMYRFLRLVCTQDFRIFLLPRRERRILCIITVTCSVFRAEGTILILNYLWVIAARHSSVRLKYVFRLEITNNWVWIGWKFMFQALSSYTLETTTFRLNVVPESTIIWIPWIKFNPGISWCFWR